MTAASTIPMPCGRHSSWTSALQSHRKRRGGCKNSWGWSELDPNRALAYVNRGLAYGNKGEFDKAIADCNKAIELEPKLAPAYRNRGIAYGNKGEYDKEIAESSFCRRRKSEWHSPKK